MASMSAEIIITVDNFDLAKKQVREGVDRAVRALAFGIQAAAMDHIRQYPESIRPIDTGAMLNSIYVTTSDSDGRVDAIANATAAGSRPGIKSGMTNPATPGIPSDFGKKIMEAKVAVLVEYGVYVEEGTSRMAGRPFLKPAFGDVRPKVNDIVKMHVNRALNL